VLFIYSGVTKLFGIQATAEFISAKVVIPVVLAPYATQLEGMTGMTTPQLLAIAVGVFEVVSGFRRKVLCNPFDYLRGHRDLLFPRFLESGATRQC
jgi:hypothetical protein